MGIPLIHQGKGGPIRRSDILNSASTDCHQFTYLEKNLPVRNMIGSVVYTYRKMTLRNQKTMLTLSILEHRQKKYLLRKHFPTVPILSYGIFLHFNLVVYILTTGRFVHIKFI